jgi:hypothetical protein
VFEESRSQPQPLSQGSVGSSNSTKILAPIVQAVAVLMFNLRPTRAEVFVHVNVRTFNPCNRIEPPLSIPTYEPVMSSYSFKIFSGHQAFENRPVLTLQDNGCTMAKFESVWTLPFGPATVPMNKAKRLTHYMTVSPVAFRHNLRLSPASAHAQAGWIRPYLLVLSQSHNCSLSLRFRVPASPLCTRFLQLRLPRVRSDANSRLTQTANQI